MAQPRGILDLSQIKLINVGIEAIKGQLRQNFNQLLTNTLALQISRIDKLFSAKVDIKTDFGSEKSRAWHQLLIFQVPPHCLHLQEKLKTLYVT